MNQLVSINGHALGVKEFHGQRVVTFRDVDECHERPEGTAGRNFRENRKHFIVDEDFFCIDQPDEIRRLGFARPQGGTPGNLILLTESGYLMLVKSFTDDLAWQVQRVLVNSYFRVQQTDHREEIALLNARALVLEAQAHLLEVQNSVPPALPLNLQRFRRQVKEAMEGQRYTNLARRLGISRSYLCHILTTDGENARAPQRYIREIADILGLTEVNGYDS